ncbi:MAG TPA: hypothetical protein VKR27_00110 [Acidimicrobiales bacterium]|nr:hypothetical protein [Acidimicrobiales bacterium]
MASLAYILGIGGPVVAWTVIAWLLVRASRKPGESASAARSAERRVRAHP